jgi:hypothetical protein
MPNPIDDRSPDPDPPPEGWWERWGVVLILTHLFAGTPFLIRLWGKFGRDFRNGVRP